MELIWLFMFLFTALIFSNRTVFKALILRSISEKTAALFFKDFSKLDFLTDKAIISDTLEDILRSVIPSKAGAGKLVKSSLFTK